MKATVTGITIMAALLGSFAAQADDWKDESGKGRGYGNRGGVTVQVPYPAAPPSYDPRYQPRTYYYGQRMPDGHMPPPGECRVWYPDRPAGHQPPPFKC
jgi:hypothetical protein